MTQFSISKDHTAPFPFVYALTVGGTPIAYADTIGNADRISALWDLPLPGDAPGDDSPETGPSTGDDDDSSVWASLPSETRQEIDLLCACASGEHIRDWAMVDALAAHVRRTMAEVLR